MLVLSGFGSAVIAQKNETWEKWNWLIGDWTGEGSGSPGQGSGWFSLLPDLDNKILVRKNHSEYPATKDKPQVIHDDLMIVYRNIEDGRNKAVYFDNEGHVINYTASFSGNSIILTSDNIPNFPVFRLTYDSLDIENINVKFEMSRDGVNFLTYTEGICRRIK